MDILDVLSEGTLIFVGFGALVAVKILQEVAVSSLLMLPECNHPSKLLFAFVAMNRNSLSIVELHMLLECYQTVAAFKLAAMSHNIWAPVFADTLVLYLLVLLEAFHTGKVLPRVAFMTDWELTITVNFGFVVTVGITPGKHPWAVWTPAVLLFPCRRRRQSSWNHHVIHTQGRVNPCTVLSSESG